MHSDETAKLIKDLHEIDATNFIGIVGMALIEVQSQQWLSALNALKPVQGEYDPYQYKIMKYASIPIIIDFLSNGSVIVIGLKTMEQVEFV